MIALGADPNAVDKSGVAPLHRAVRTRCAAPVRALLEGGADAQQKERQWFVAMLLATHQTGRGGSGSVEAKAQQAQIIELLERWRDALMRHIGPGGPPPLGRRRSLTSRRH